MVVPQSYALVQALRDSGLSGLLAAWRKDGLQRKGAQVRLVPMRFVWPPQETSVVVRVLGHIRRDNASSGHYDIRVMLCDAPTPHCSRW